MTRRRQRASCCALAIAFCALHAWMAASVSRTFSTTFDEIAHVTAGYLYWKTSDYRFHPENGNLPQRLAALPLLAQDLTAPPASGDAWRSANIWRLGHAFFHESGNDLPRMLAASRAMIAFLSGALCFLIFLWTDSLFGRWAALLALILAAFSPTLLAHGGLATSDTAAAFGFCAASFTWWRLLQRVTVGRLLAAGLAAGVLAISKYSVALFAPIALLLVGVRLLRRAPLVLVFHGHRIRLRGWSRLPALVGIAVAAAALTVAILWSAYGFRYRAASPESPGDATFYPAWEKILLTDSKGTEGAVDLRAGPVQHFVAWARERQLLPEAWLYGLAFVDKHARGRMAYFAGEYSLTGWREFFPAVFLLKTTLPALLLGILGLVALALGPRHRRYVRFYRIAPLLVLLGVYWTFSIQSTLNIGHRHLLPIYPPFYILAGASILLIKRQKLGMLLSIVLLTWQVRESLAIRPDYLAYFNSLAGGPQQAHRLFVDSSLDWGQDLPRLRTWLDQNAQGERVFLSYFGTGSPNHAGIDAVRIGDAIFDRESRSTVPTLRSGIYCISATMLSRIHSPVRGPWSDRREASYQQLSAWLRHLRAQPADAPPTWFDGTVLEQDEVSARMIRYEHLVFGRLCSFLQLRQPDARIGYSLFIFRLTDEEIFLIHYAPLPRSQGLR